MDSNSIYGLMGSIALAYLIPKVSPYLDSIFRRAFDLLLTSVHNPIKGYFRGMKLRRLRNFRNDRRNDSAVTAQIVKSYAYLLLFWGVFAFYVNLLFNENIVANLDGNLAQGMLLTIPIYVVEFIWLSASGRAKKLVASRGKLGL